MILLPVGRPFEEHYTAWGQSLPTDLPPLKLVPIEHGDWLGDLRTSDILWVFAGKDTLARLSSFAADLLERHKRPKIRRPSVNKEEPIS